MRIRGSRGLTLLELILGMTMMAIIILSVSILENSLLRIQGLSREGKELQNHLTYVMRLLENDLGNSERVQINAMPNPTDDPPTHLYQWTVRPFEGDPAGADDIVYTIDLRGGSAMTFTRAEDGVTSDIVAPGSVAVGPLEHSEAPSNQLAVWPANGFQHLSFNLRLNYAGAYASAVALTTSPVIQRSFLIRTANVQDCRSGGCL